MLKLCGFATFLRDFLNCDFENSLHNSILSNLKEINFRNLLSLVIIGVVSLEHNKMSKKLTLIRFLLFFLILLNFSHPKDLNSHSRLENYRSNC